MGLIFFINLRGLHKIIYTLRKTEVANDSANTIPTLASDNAILYITYTPVCVKSTIYTHKITIRTYKVSVSIISYSSVLYLAIPLYPFY